MTNDKRNKHIREEWEYHIDTILKLSQVKANEVGMACGTHGKGGKSVQGFGEKARRKETTWKTKA
jgi:hypothetical protein